MSKNLFILGNGIRNNTELIDSLVSSNVPCLTTWMSMDLLPENSSVFVGRFGTIGQRASNIILQKAEKIHIFGARLDDDSVAFRLNNFGKNAAKYIYDVDQAELDKFPDDENWKKTKINTKDILYPIIDDQGDDGWLEWCKNLYNHFSFEQDGKDDDNFVDIKKFVSLMSDLCKDDEVVALGSSGTAPVSFLHNFKVKNGQRIIGCSTIGSMGLDIPMAIGACIANEYNRVVCPTGDG